MKTVESEILDQVSEEFLTDGDLNEVLDQFSRGTISPDEMKDRCVFLLQCAERRAVERVLSPELDTREDDEHVTHLGVG